MRQGRSGRLNGGRRESVGLSLGMPLGWSSGPRAGRSDGPLGGLAVGPSPGGPSIPRVLGGSASPSLALLLACPRLRLLARGLDRSVARSPRRSAGPSFSFGGMGPRPRARRGRSPCTLPPSLSLAALSLSPPPVGLLFPPLHLASFSPRCLSPALLALALPRPLARPSAACALTAAGGVGPLRPRPAGPGSPQPRGDLRRLNAAAGRHPAAGCGGRPGPWKLWAGRSSPAISPLPHHICCLPRASASRRCAWPASAGHGGVGQTQRHTLAPYVAPPPAPCSPSLHDRGSTGSAGSGGRSSGRSRRACSDVPDASNFLLRLWKRGRLSSLEVQEGAAAVACTDAAGLERIISLASVAAAGRQPSHAQRDLVRLLSKSGKGRVPELYRAKATMRATQRAARPLRGRTDRRALRAAGQAGGRPGGGRRPASGRLAASWRAGGAAGGHAKVERARCGRGMRAASGRTGGWRRPTGGESGSGGTRKARSLRRASSSSCFRTSCSPPWQPRTGRKPSPEYPRATKPL